MAEHAKVYVGLHGAKDADGRDEVMDKRLRLKALSKADGVKHLVPNFQAKDMEGQSSGHANPSHGCEKGHERIVHYDEKQLSSRALPRPRCLFPSLLPHIVLETRRYPQKNARPCENVAEQTANGNVNSETRTHVPDRPRTKLDWLICKNWYK